MPGTGTAMNFLTVLLQSCMISGFWHLQIPLLWWSLSKDLGEGCDTDEPFVVAHAL